MRLQCHARPHVIPTRVGVNRLLIDATAVSGSDPHARGGEPWSKMKLMRSCA